MAEKPKISPERAKEMQERNRERSLIMNQIKNQGPQTLDELSKVPYPEHYMPVGQEPTGASKELLENMRRDHGVDPKSFTDLEDKLIQFYPPEPREPVIVAREMLPRMIRTLYGSEKKESVHVQTLTGVPLPEGLHLRSAGGRGAFLLQEDVHLQGLHRGGYSGRHPGDVQAREPGERVLQPPRPPRGPDPPRQVALHDVPAPQLVEGVLERRGIHLDIY
jgi:hypothetical protein